MTPDERSLREGLVEASGSLLARSGARLRAGTPADAASCAAIFNAWVDATDWMPRVHAAQDVVRHYREWVLATCGTVVAVSEAGDVVGYLALDGEGYVAGLFVAGPYRGRGVGAELLRAAKASGPDTLTLWTFVANAGARRFYARHGFVEIGGTDGDNEERLPDVQLQWRAWR